MASCIDDLVAPLAEQVVAPLAEQVAAPLAEQVAAPLAEQVSNRVKEWPGAPRGTTEEAGEAGEGSARDTRT